MITKENLGIVVPCYKWCENLHESLMSLEAACSEADIEMVLVRVNAGAHSKDHAEVIKNKLGGYPRFVVSAADSPERLPIARNWNQCCDLLGTEYVHIMHDDDIASRYFYKEIFRLSDDHPGCALYATGVAVFGEKNFLVRHTMTSGILAEASRKLVHGNIFCCPEVVFRRADFAGFPEEIEYALDWRAWFLHSLQGEVAVSSDILMNYRYHTANSTTRLQAAGVTFKEALALEKKNCDDFNIKYGEIIHPTYQSVCSAAGGAIARSVQGSNLAVASGLFFRASWLLKCKPKLFFRLLLAALNSLARKLV